MFASGQVQPGVVENEQVRGQKTPGRFCPPTGLTWLDPRYGEVAEGN